MEKNITVHYMATNISNPVKSRKKTIPPLPEKIWQDPFYFLAFGLGSGTAPIAPGTFGTLMAIPFYLLLQHLPLIAYLFFVLIFIIVSIWICDRVSREMQVHDHPGICLDEFAGFFVTMISAPIGWYWIVVGFFLFRLFDIWKPWPIRYFDKKIQGGLGIVLDDVMAGVFSMIVMYVIAWLNL